MRLRQYPLEHECVDIDHAILEQMQRQHADLVILMAVADQFATASEEHEIGRAVDATSDEDGDLSGEWMHRDFRSTCQEIMMPRPP